MPKKHSNLNKLVFGTSSKRFKNLGIHPQLVRFNNSNPLGPGQYHPHPFECAYKSKSASWKVKLESEEFSKYLGFRNPKLLKDRLFERTLGGPGTLDLFDRKEKTGASTFDNVGFSKEERFKVLIKDETLPPGSHNIKKPKTNFNTVPTFEWDGLAPRIKTTEPSYRKAPNRYTLPPDSIVNKIVSKRGPYDTFTGPRDGTTIKNHFAPPMFKPPDTFYPVPSALDYLLHNKNKKRCGKFLTAERFPDYMTVKVTKNNFAMFESDQFYPGPADYNCTKIFAKTSPNLYPFNSSNINARPPTNWKIHPGPDRYQVKYHKCHLKKKYKNSWMFLSNQKREVVKVQDYAYIFD